MSQINGWKYFFDFNEKGTDLGNFLNESVKKELKDKRVFYIVRSVAEPNVIKFGISDGAGYYRLNSYVVSYGYRGRRNSCTGVDLLFLGGTRQHEHVAWNNSRVYKLELQLKRTLKTISNRGDERTHQSLDVIKAAMLKNKTDDTVVKPKRNPKRVSVGDTVDYKKSNGKVQKATVVKVETNNVLIQMNGDGKQILVNKDKINVTFS